MVQDRSISRRTFEILNYALLGVLGVLCVFPVVHVLMISLSSSAAVAGGRVTVWPVEPTIASYRYVISQDLFGRAFLITIERVILGTGLNLTMCILVAYPLSRDPRHFKMRGVYVWVFVFTMLFNGGLVPTYMTVRYTGLIDTIWALVLPVGVQVFHIVLMLNFFRGIPRELDEAAVMDGAGHLTTLVRIYLPLSLPSLATITLFTMVFHWNSWFDGLIYMNRPENYPLQSFLQTVVINLDLTHVTERDLEVLRIISNRTNRAAQIFVATVPILLVYPFLQRFFIKGIVLGSVKG